MILTGNGRVELKTSMWQRTEVESILLKINNNNNTYSLKSKLKLIFIFISFERILKIRSLNKYKGK